MRKEFRIPLLGVYPKKTIIPKDTCTPIFIAALKTWKQPNKKNEIMPFTATWMDLEMVILSQLSQTEREKYYMTSLICGI